MRNTNLSELDIKTIRVVRMTLTQRFHVSEEQLKCMELRTWTDHMAGKIVEAAFHVFKRQVDEDELVEERKVWFGYRRPATNWDAFLDVLSKIPHLPKWLEWRLRRRVTYETVQQSQTVAVKVNRKSYRMVPVLPHDGDARDKQYALWMSGADFGKR